jgi:hypothetical protein
MPRKKEVKWFSSKAKSMLRDDILAGNVDDKMCPKLVYQSRAEFQKFPFDRFKPNLKSLLDKIKEERKRMGEDAKAYGHDMALLVKKAQGRSGRQSNSCSSYNAMAHVRSKKASPARHRRW